MVDDVRIEWDKSGAPHPLVDFDFSKIEDNEATAWFVGGMDKDAFESLMFAIGTLIDWICPLSDAPLNSPISNSTILIRACVVSHYVRPSALWAPPVKGIWPGAWAFHVGQSIAKPTSFGGSFIGRRRGCITPGREKR